MSRWHHANEARTQRKLMRRARFLAAIGSGVPTYTAAEVYGIPERTARRYIAEAL